MKEKLRTVLSDTALVRKLVDSLCYSKGGPLPDWDEVYEEHCGATGEIIDERSDLGCVQLSFPDGHKYWYPSKAVSSTLPDLKSSIKTRYTNEQIIAKMTSIVHQELGPTVVDAVEETMSSARRDVSENEEWCLLFAHSLKHLASRTTPATAQLHRVKELERELASSQALVARMQDTRESSVSEKIASNTHESAQEALSQLQTENEELKMQVRSAEELKSHHTREYSILSQKCEGLEKKLRKGDISTGYPSPTTSEKRVSIPSLSEFKSVTIGGVNSERPNPPSPTPLNSTPSTPVTTPAYSNISLPIKDRGQRSVTPPARMSGVGGVRRASTPPARRGTGGVTKTAAATPAAPRQNLPSPLDRRVRRQESIRSTTSSLGGAAPVRTRSPRTVTRSPTYGSGATRRVSPTRGATRDADWPGLRAANRMHPSPSAAAVASRKYHTTSFSRSNTTGYDF